MRKERIAVGGDARGFGSSRPRPRCASGDAALHRRTCLEAGRSQGCRGRPSDIRVQEKRRHPANPRSVPQPFPINLCGDVVDCQVTCGAISAELRICRGWLAYRRRLVLWCHDGGSHLPWISCQIFLADFPVCTGFAGLRVDDHDLLLGQTLAAPYQRPQAGRLDGAAS